MATPIEVIISELIKASNEAASEYAKTKDSYYREKSIRYKRIVDGISNLDFGGGGSGVTSFNTRTGAVTLTSGDVTTALGYTPLSSVPTLDQVTTAGNTTANAISIGSLAVDTNLIYTDAVNNRVGIGTSSPSQKLHLVGGNARLEGNIYFGDANHYLYTDNATYAMLSSNRNLQLARNGNAALTVASTLNVLIGTTTDAGYKLDVNGTARVQGNIYLNDSKNRYIYGFNGTYIKFYDSLTGGLDIYNLNGTSATRNYGALEVYGNLTTTGSFSMNGNLNIGNGNYLTANSSFYNKIYPYNSSNANMRFVVGHPTTGDFDWEYPLNTVLVRLKRSGNLLIGTTTDAGYKLDVNGTARTSDTLIKGSGNTSSTNALSTQNSDGTAMFSVRNDRVIRLLSRVDFGNVQFYPINDGAYTLASNASQLRVETVFVNGTTTGDFGFSFGTFSAQESSNANVKSVVHTGSFAPTSGTKTYTTTEIRGVINQTGGANGITRGLYVNPTLTAAADFRAIETTAGNVVFNGGNVGIGTTAPSSKLQLGKDASTLGSNVFTMYRGGSTGQYTTIENQGGTVYKSYGVGGHVFYHDPAQEAMRVAATTGNLLVGTATDAGYRLDVQGGDARFAQNVEAASYSVAGNAGYSGIINFPSNPPGFQNLEFLQGILINVF